MVIPDFGKFIFVYALITLSLYLLILIDTAFLHNKKQEIWFTFILASHQLSTHPLVLCASCLSYALSIHRLSKDIFFISLAGNLLDESLSLECIIIVLLFGANKTLIGIPATGENIFKNGTIAEKTFF